MEFAMHLDWFEIIFCLALGFGVSWGAQAIILRVYASRKTVQGSRDFHHTHKVAVPRLGGIGIFVAFSVVALAIYLSQSLLPFNVTTLAVIVLSSFAIFALGLIDDFHSIPARWKLLAQIAIASAVYACDIRIEIFKNPVTDVEFGLGIFGFFATVLWLVTLTNLINLVDGIDGLAGGISLMLMVLVANLWNPGSTFVMLLSIGVAGALLGFLKYNYPPARIYLGDGGAYFLGFLIGILSIVNSNKGSIVAALIAPTFALALPVVDTSLAILRRGVPGLPLFRPDRKHIHHHLLVLGFSRERAVLTLYTVSLCCLVIAFGVFYWQGRLLPLFSGLLFVVLLIAGYLSGYTKNWYTIGSRLGKLFALRKETRYALTLSRWLAMEMERNISVIDLWHDYQFVARKLGFSRIKLTLPDSTHIWEAKDYEQNISKMRHGWHELTPGTTIEFEANKSMMSELLFDLLSDLASEMWYKAASRWKVINHCSVEDALKITLAETSEHKNVIPMFASPPKGPFPSDFITSDIKDVLLR